MLDEAININAVSATDVFEDKKGLGFGKVRDCFHYGIQFFTQATCAFRSIVEDSSLLKKHRLAVAALQTAATKSNPVR